MDVFRSLTDLKLAGHSAVALGYFDGLHLGHSVVVRRTLAYENREGLRPCVFTFTMKEEHPAFKATQEELISEEEKLALLESWGVDTVVMPEFSAFSRLSPEQFVREILMHKLGAGAVCCGNDYRFGRDASGGVDELVNYCTSKGIVVEQVPSVTWMGKRVSSSWIRARLVAGDMDAATGLLGRPFSFRLPVEHGHQLGRTIESPTLNQTLPLHMAKLRLGVYASMAGMGDAILPAVTNVGLRPTVAGGEPPVIKAETYIIDFDGDLYGKMVEVRLLRFLRDEKKFSSLDELREQIQKDVQAAVPVAKAYLKKKR